MRVGCDIGGTFTDLVALDPERRALRVGKALNSGAGPAGGLTAALGAAGVGSDRVSELSHGTTTVTNLLIERTGARVGLVCTRGFRDVLELQYGFRARTFDARYHKTPPLVPRERRLEVGGRIDHRGRVVEPLERDEVDEVLRELLNDGVQCLAVALYNAYANPAHEREVAARWSELAPEVPVTCSTEVDRRIGEYERVSTGVINATAIPHMRSYVDDIRATVAAPTLYMHSAGGVLTAGDAAEHPVQLAFSGPAAGVLAAREVARELGLEGVITLDMGGTSCDVCLLRGDELTERESFDVAWGIPARVRSLDITTIGAGGGSIAWRDSGGALCVGPVSSGAEPGPACYGRGGTRPTVTDANLALGILPADGLLGGELALDGEAALSALGGLADDFGVGPAELAAAVHRTVNANMAQAVREITVRHGIDPRSCALVAFGGAGPQHATGVASELGVTTVVVPACCSVLSAIGLLTAELRVSAARTALVDAGELGDAAISALYDELIQEAASRLAGWDAGEVVAERWAGLRYRDQWHEVALPLGEDAGTLVMRFEDEHERRFGTRLGDPVEVVDVWVTLAAPRPGALAALIDPEGDGETGDARRELADESVAVYRRAALDGDPVEGPCLVEEDMAVTNVPAGWSVSVRAGHLVVETRT
jgi:N-methylhydantoinase A